VEEPGSGIIGAESDDDTGLLNSNDIATRTERADEIDMVTYPSDELTGSHN
jgi:hypothetical protein